ncbi:uncharacterized protein DS421_15g494590 [Arachis hypogaea]|nr:uncharacterized protein DS421_15g494590 [Arachis hypogaea]
MSEKSKIKNKIKNTHTPVKLTKNTTNTYTHVTHTRVKQTKNTRNTHTRVRNY